MKPAANTTEHDQNWHWPEKTWFRERLNAVKAQEHEQRRKVLVNAKRPEQDSPSGSSDNSALKTG
ncbi:MAG: hypothetical protein ACM3SP_22750 [Chloroflexota bacterium]